MQDVIDGCTIVHVTSLDVQPAGADNKVEVPIPVTDAQQRHAPDQCDSGGGNK